MKKRAIQLLALFICSVLLLSSCAKKPTSVGQSTTMSEDQTEERSPDIASDQIMKSNREIAISGGYAYFFQLVQSEKYKGLEVSQLMRRNLTTGEVSSPCIDPLCTHDTIDCPCFGARTVSPLYMFGDWLCIQTTFLTDARKEILKKGGSGATIRRIMYNTETGEWFELFKKQSDTGKNYFKICSDGENVYGVTYGSALTDPETGEKYVPSVIRAVNLKSREEREVYSHKYQIRLVAVAQNRMYFYELLGEDICRYYSVDTEGNDLREEPGFKIIPLNIYQNKMYGINNSVDRQLAINDLETGELNVLDCYISRDAIDVTEEYLYYLETEGYEELTRRIDSYTSDDLKDPVKEAEWRALVNQRNLCITYLWRCDPDGSNPTKILDLGLAYDVFLLVEGEYCYIYDYYYDPETGKSYWGDYQYYDSSPKIHKICRIHLETGVKETLGE